MATLEAARAQMLPVVESPQLRVLTCGSVDDGKSTLLGRLLFDADAVLEDQLAALDAESRRWGTQGAARDYALLLDGLSAEREQGITIDVAYRYFSTSRRSFILIDSPGHEQYTRNMATGASQADLAVILIDARRGVLPQTRRHAFIAATLGIRHAVLAINKMDLVDFAETRFREIAATFAKAAKGLGFASVVPIPISARDGDNVARRSVRMDWHHGPTLLEHLETVDAAPLDKAAPFRLPVQLVLRPDADFRGYAGTVASGAIRPGDRIIALPSGSTASVARIVTADGDRAEAGAGQAVTLTLDREIDVARGDVLAAHEAAPTPAHRLVANLLWMADESLLTGRDYTLHLGPATANARIDRIRHAVDVQTYAPRPATWLALNELGSVEIALDQAIVAAPYGQARALGAFILVDRVRNQTVAMGVVESVSGTGGRKVRPLRLGRLLGPAIGGAAIAGLSALFAHDLALAVTLGSANVLLVALIGRLTSGWNDAALDIDPRFVISGLFVGILVGQTGVGGGSLMTPLLVMLFGINPATAIGTDLLYASATKSVGTLVHGLSHTVDWQIVRRLATGSLPGTALTLIVISQTHIESSAEAHAITFVLGVMLILTAIALLLRSRILTLIGPKLEGISPARQATLTIVTGALLGIFVTLSSVGAGALGVTALLLLYPRAPMAVIVGTDIAHAVPLTLLAGLGHWYLGGVNLHLLMSLLTGSIPGIIVGSWLAARMPEMVLRPVLAVTLAVVGVKIVF